MKIINFLFYLLLASAFTSGLRMDLGSEKYSVFLSYSQLISFILFICILFYNKSYNANKIKTNVIDLLILLYFILNVFSSVFFSPNPIISLKTCGNIFSFILTYFVTQYISLYLYDINKAIDNLNRFNIISVLFGLICFFLVLTGASTENIGATFQHAFKDYPSIKSFGFEPNIFASVTAIIFCFNISSFFVHFYKYNNRPVIILTFVSIIFAFTRTVYFAIPFAILVGVGSLLKNKIKGIAKIILIIISLFIVSEVIVAENAGLSSIIFERVSNLFDYESGSGATRMWAYQTAFESFGKHPIFGNGTMTANTEYYNQYTGIRENIASTKGWLTGAWIQSLHDTGFIGFIIIFLLFYLMININYKYYKLLKTDNDKVLVLGFFMGNIILAITSQVSSTLFVTFPWIYWGINVAMLKKINLVNNQVIPDE